MRRCLPLGCALIGVLLALPGCDLLNPDRPVSHADTEIFGNLLEVRRVGNEEHAWLVRIRVGVPRALSRAEQQGGHPTPTLEEGLVADVLVTSDTVVLVGGRPVAVEDINPGTEMAVIPVLGTTRMIGTSNLSVQALYLTDFDTYRRWRLPGMAQPGDEREARDDPDRINSDGIEHAAVPVGDGSVLYFAARLRPPPHPGDPWQGARRAGLPDPAKDGGVMERTYRTELGGKGWSPPALVRFPGLDQAQAVRVSWMSEDETSCLVTVEQDEGSWVGKASRPSAKAPWGEVMRQSLVEGARLSDAVYLAGSRAKMVVTVGSAAGAPTDLWLFDPSAETTFLPLQPEINTDASEWGARVGPDNRLFFNRQDRQLVFSGGTVRPLRLAAPHRIVITEAAPTDDGRSVFFCLPTYVPVELDQDIYVAALGDDLNLGTPVPVDDWRPSGSGDR